MQYWHKNDTDIYYGQAFFGDPNISGNPGKWGTYGGPGGNDIYKHWTEPYGAEPATVLTESPEIANEQLNQAASYTAGLLMAISSSMPPAVLSYSLNSVSNAPVVVNPGKENIIRFTLLDNRTKTVKYRLVLDGANEILPEVTVSLIYNTDALSLPFKLPVTLSWNGTLASGSKIPQFADGGLHTLYITGEDEDHNPFNVPIASFTVSGGPFVSVGSPVSTPYVKFSGVSISTAYPASLNPNMFGGKVSVTMEPNGSPIAELKVKKPDGNYLQPVTLSGAGEVKTFSFSTPDDGRYELTVIDQAGNSTFAPFSVGTLSVGVAPEEATAQYTVPTDMFSAQLKMHLRDGYTLEKAELLDADGTSVRTDPLSSKTADITYAFPDLFGTYGLTHDFNFYPETRVFTVKLSDKEGHTLEQGFSLNGVTRQYWGGDDIDLLNNAGFLTSALGRTKPELQMTGVTVEDAVSSGTIVDYQYIGSYTAYVLTGNRPDYSDALRKTLSTGSYWLAGWNFFNNPPPENCVGQPYSGYTAQDCQNGVAGADTNTCGGAVSCSNYTMMVPVTLGRYNRLEITAIPGEYSGIFRTMCTAPVADNPNACEGNYPKLIANPAGMEVWGVSYSSGAAKFAGSLGAPLPVGNNVTVKLSDWLSMTFDNVMKAGYVSVSLISLPDVPGMLPIRALSFGGVGDGEYTGNIRVAVKYDAGVVTDEQIGFMEALKINDVYKRDFDRRSTLVDKVSHVATFSTPDLGNFVLGVPSYPTPYALFSDSLIGGMPEFGLMAGVPGSSASRVTAGSQIWQIISDVLNGHGLVPVGNMYLLGPTGQQFPSAAAVKMLYDKAELVSKKLIENSFGIFQISEDGKYFGKLANSVLNPSKGEITAEVSEFHSVFVIAGSTEPALPPALLPDVSAPLSHLAYSIPAYEKDGMTMISSSSLVFIDAHDPEVAGDITAGQIKTYYLVDAAPESCTVEPTLEGPAGTCLNPVYSGPFALSAGQHTVWYKSEDGVENMEAIKSKVLYVDGSAPVVEVSALGQNVPAGGSAYVTIADSVTFNATDPANGPASGVGGIAFDISTFPCTGFMNYPQGPGACRKIIYTGPFSLPIGTHTVYYTAMDNVGNMAEIKTVTVMVSEVAEPPGAPAGAVGYWKFDEAAGLTAADSSGGGNDATLVNGAAWAAGKLGGALSLDGVNDYATLANGGIYDTLLDGHHAFSISFWINRQDKNATQGIFSKGSDPVFTAMYLNSGALGYAPTFLIKSGTGVSIDVGTGQVGPALGDWEHWAATYDGSGNSAGVKIYRNGASLPLTIYNNSLGASAMHNTAPVEFGRVSGLNWYLRAGLDDTRLYDRALTAAEVSALALLSPAPTMVSIAVSPASVSVLAGSGYQLNATGGFSDGTSRILVPADGAVWSVDYSTVATVSATGLATGVAPGVAHITVSSGALSAVAELFVTSPSTSPVGYWKFNEAAGLTAADSSGGGNDASLVNGATWAAGKLGGALSFDGADDYATLANGGIYDSLLDGHHAFSLSMWIKRQEKDATQGIFSKGTDPVFTAMFLNSSAFGYAPTFLIKSDTGVSIDVGTGDIGPAFNEWEHWTATYDGSGDSAGVKIYRNGVSLPLTVYSNNLGASAMHNTDALEFGRVSGLEWYLRALLDDARLYGRVLAASEVAALTAEKPLVVLNSIEISPAVNTVAAGAVQPLVAKGFFSDGSSRELAAADGVTWAVGYSTVATVDATGLVLGQGPGATPVVASSGGITASAAVYVPDPPRTSDDGLVSIATLGEEISVSSLPVAAIPSTAPVFTAMAGQLLTVVMPALYEFEPSGVQFAAPVTIAFTFDPISVDTATVAIYYFDGVDWSTGAVANQRITYGADGLATVSGEISHTSVYALLRVNTAPRVKLDLDPDTINLKSRGGTITARLSLEPGDTGCFIRDTINISAINGQQLGAPIPAQAQGGYAVECGSTVVKFSREAVAALLPSNAQAKLTLSGSLQDGRVFSGEDTVRAIKAVRVSDAGEFSSSAEAEFKLGEVYVYPDPAKGGKVPVFHIEVGTADSVKIRVFTVAGRLAHEGALGGPPRQIGSAYAYEYAWEGRIASGVYYYTVEAERAGRKLKAKGKFSVIR